MQKYLCSFISLSMLAMTFHLCGNKGLVVFDTIYAPQKPWLYQSFDQAMDVAHYEKEIARTKEVTGIEGDAFLNYCRHLYDWYNPSQLLTIGVPKIPKIIHQIWIGGKPVPEVFRPYMQSWIDQHMGRGWYYKLWTDDDLAEFALDNQQFFDATENIGVKSDLLRYEILYRYGGVYIDTDYECLQPLDLFLAYDLYTALQPLDTGFAQLGIALIGCIPGHPILKHCIETIKDDWSRHGATVKTGPIHFSRSFYLVAGQSGMIDIAFPAYYFYPQGCQQTDLLYEEWIENGAYAIHHWAKSWMPEQYRRHSFRTFENQALCVNWDK